MQHKFNAIIPILILTSSLFACGGVGGGGGSAPPGPITTPPPPPVAISNPVGGSHNAGMDCMSSGCHVQGGAGTGVFTSAGTVYRSSGAVQPNATVVLYLHATNTIVASLETDASGNFYTTDAVDGLFVEGGPRFVTGVDVEVRGPGGDRIMNGLITAGSCNTGGCHDSGRKIIAN